MFNNIPKAKVGIVAVSRDCFPASLAINRRKALIDAYTAKYDKDDIYECPVCIIESEIHMVEALEDVKKAGCNALVVYLPRHCLQSILKDRRCSAQLQRRPRAICVTAAAMLTAVC